VERLSYPALVGIHRLPRWLLVVAMVVLLVGGLAAPRPFGPVCLGVVAVFLGWLTYLAWPEGGRGRRGMRVVAMLLAIGATVVRAVGG